MTRTRPLFAASVSVCALLAGTYTGDASACGGLFCDSSAPVNQAAERIIFAKNDDGTVTAVIEILYEGPSPEFAWVLPVPPGKTEVGVSSKNALDALDSQSNPRYQLNRNFGDCGGRNASKSAPGALSGADGEEAAQDDGIQVVAEGNAGPYIYQQIMADPALKDPASAAIMWLEENGYEVTQLAPELLGEYLSDGMNLIAFKLQKGKDAGSIRPVLLNYKSERPLIPIKPTALAANDDMGIKAWVLGDSRAISNNYPDLVLNESLIDWFSPNNTYNDVVIAAANEADGGQGFVTEQSGPAGAFAENMYPSWQADAYQQLRTQPFNSLLEFFQATTTFAGFDGYNDLMLDPEVVPLREGATHEQFLSCMECYFQAKVPVRNEAYPDTPYPGEELDPIHTMVPKEFLAKFYTLVIEPLEKTRALFEDHAMVTRFYTTLSADEMTVDPEFDFNPNLPDVDNVHVAEQLMACEDDSWSVTLPQGMIVRGEGRTWPITLEEKSIPVNLRVVQLSKKGEGNVIQDNAKKIAGLLTDLKLGEATPALTNPDEETDGTTIDKGSAKNGIDDSAEDSGGGDGCSVSAQPRSNWDWLAAFGLLLPLLRRRRSRRSAP